MSHSHSRDHDDHHDLGHGDGSHDHSDDVESVLQGHIYQPIEFSKITTLNESEPDSGSKVVAKTWAERLDLEPILRSEADAQLLMTVPFAGTVKLHSLLIRSSDSIHAPQTVKIYLNQEGLDFSAMADLEPAQTLTLSRTSEVQEVAVKRRLFNNTYSLTLFFENNFGDDDEELTEIYYLGFKGEFTRLNREPVEVLYEKAANPKDHTLIQGVGGMTAQGPRSGM